MMIEDVSNKGDMLVVTIPDSKTKKKRLFAVTDEIIGGVSTLEMCRNYVSSRSPKTPHSRFFVNYKNGKSTQQVIGKNTLAKIPYKIAQFLKLKNAHQYTGHCFRRTSATLLVNSGGDIITLKQHGGWESAAVAEGYIAECISKKREVASQIITGQKLKHVSISSTQQEIVTSLKNNSEIQVPRKVQPINSSTSSLKIREIQENSATSSITSSNQQHLINILSDRTSPTGGISFNNLTNCTISFNNCR